MNEELKAIIKDLYQVEKNPETILTVLRDEGNELNIDQVNEVLGIKNPEPAKKTIKKDVIVKAQKPVSDIEEAIKEAAEAIEQAQLKVNIVWIMKKNAGQEAGRYVRAVDQLRKLKNTVQG